MSNEDPASSAVGRGDLVVLSAPSGCGKSTLLRAVFEHHPDLAARLAFSVSHTSRPARPEEVDGRDYHFIDRPSFEALIAADAFLEWAEVHGQLKGTSHAEVDGLRRQGRDVLLEIDVQGAAVVRRKVPAAVSLFILPPSFTELERRLRGRGSETEAQIARRLRDARRELEQVGEFDYVIVNADLVSAREALSSVLRARRYRRHRMQRDIDRVLGTLPGS